MVIRWECFCRSLTGQLQSNGANLFALFYQSGETYASFNVDADYEPAFYEVELAAEQAAAAGDAARQQALDQAIATCAGRRQCLFDYLITRTSLLHMR